MRQMDDRVLPAATPQLGGVIPRRLTNAFDVIEQPYLSTDKLSYPYCHGV
jgi:hypothetical protein